MKTPALLLLLLFGAHCASAQKPVTIVLADEYNTAVHGAVIRMGNTTLGVSDSNGKCSVILPPKPRLLEISHVSFFTKTLLSSTLPDTIFLFRNEELLGELQIKAFEKNSSIKNLAVAASVISKNSIEKFAGNSLVSAVNSAAGVKMDERSPGSYRLSIRGNLLRSTFGVRNVRIYWDDIPFTDASGNSYLNLVSPEDVQSIQILKGPSGSMYGSGTGGVMLLRSYLPTAAHQQQFEAKISGGSFGAFNASVSLRKTTKNDNAISLTHQQADGYRQHSRMRRDIAHYTGSHSINSRLRINENILLADLKYETPGGLTFAERKINPQQSRPAAGIFQSAITQQTGVHLRTMYAGVAANYQLNPFWKNTTALFGSYTDARNPTIRNFEQKQEKGYGARTVLQVSLQKFTGTLGAEVQSGNFYAAISGNNAGSTDTLQFTTNLLCRQQNIFIQTEFQLPAGLEATAGISYNNFFYGFEKISGPLVEQDKHNFQPEIVPRLALLKKFETFNIYASVSKGYAPPGIDEVFAGNDIFNRSLTAEQAINYEAGIKADVIKNKVWFDLSVYTFRLKNTITSKRLASGGDLYNNAGTTRQSGAEMSANYLAINRSNGFIRLLKFSTAITAINARFKDYEQNNVRYNGNFLTGTAPNTAVLDADVLTAKGWYSNISLNYTDHIPLNDANSVFAHSYSLLFAKLGYKAATGKKGEINLYLSGQYALHTPYSLGNDLNAAANRYYNPAAPANLSAGIQWRCK